MQTSSNSCASGDIQVGPNLDIERLNRERISFPQNCDISLVADDGTTFFAHKDLLSMRSEFFKVLCSTEKFVESESNSCHLKIISSKALSVILDYIYTNQINHLPKDSALPVFIASHFLGLDQLRTYSSAIIARHPLDTVFNNDFFHTLPADQTGYVDDLINLPLLFHDKQPLRHSLTSWFEIDESRGTIKDDIMHIFTYRLFPKIEVAILFDPQLDSCMLFTGNSWTPWEAPESGILSRNICHLAINDTDLAYTTATAVFLMKYREERIYTEAGEPAWPPLLRRYGKGIYWTEDNRKQLWLKNPKKNAVCSYNLRARGVGSMIRNIATSDCHDYKHITLICTIKGQWKVMYGLNAVAGTTLLDLRCPLVAIEAAVILEGVLYVLGSQTANSLPITLLKYEDHWVELSRRPSETIPRAMFPLNSRIYIVCNGVPTIEVYEPTIDTWMFDAAPAFNSLTTFAVLDRNSKRL